MKFQNQLFTFAQKNFKITEKTSLQHANINGKYKTHIVLSVCVCYRSHILCRLRTLSIAQTPGDHDSDIRQTRWYSYEICDVFWQYKYGGTVLPKPFLGQQLIPVTMRVFACLLSALVLCQGKSQRCTRVRYGYRTLVSAGSHIYSYRTLVSAGSHIYSYRTLVSAGSHIYSYRTLVSAGSHIYSYRTLVSAGSHIYSYTLD
jgi:hypothetical protein